MVKLCCSDVSYVQSVIQSCIGTDNTE